MADSVSQILHDTLRALDKNLGPKWVAFQLQRPYLC